MFSGTPGSGKTFNCVQYAKKFYKMSSKYNKKHNLPMPLIYSNFPIRYKTRHGWRYSEKLTFELLTFQEAIEPNSIVVIDEFSSLITQFDYKQKNVNLFDEFCRMFRHYIGDYGRLLVCDQCSSNAVLQIRRRFNKVINYVSTNFYLNGLVCISNYRYVSISEEIKAIERVDSSPDSDDNTLKTISFHIPGFIKYIFNIKPLYDSRCFSIRYDLLFKRDNYLMDLKNPLKQYYLLKYDFVKNVDYPFTDDLYNLALKEVLENE